MEEQLNILQSAIEVAQQAKEFVNDVVRLKKFFCRVTFPKSDVADKPYTDDTDTSKYPYHMVFLSGSGVKNVIASKEPITLYELEQGQFYFVINKNADIAGYQKTISDNGTLSSFYTFNDDWFSSSSYPILLDTLDENNYYKYDILRSYGNIIWTDYDLCTYQSRCSFSISENKELFSEIRCTLTARVNVKECGVDSTGSSDVSDIIQGIIDRVDNLQTLTSGSKVSYGLVLYFPAGKYKFSKGITCKATYMKIIGEGHTCRQFPKGSDWTSTLMFEEGVTNDTLINQGESSSMWIQDISLWSYSGSFAYLDDNHPNVGNPCDFATFLTTQENVNGIYSTKSLNMRDVSFSGFSGYCVSLYQNNKVHNCNFNNSNIGIQTRYYDNLIENCFFSTLRCGIYMKTATIFCHDSWFDQIAEYGIYSESSINGMIDGNMDHIGYAGIYAPGIIYNSCIDMRMQRCGCYYAGYDINDVPDDELYKACTIYAKKGFHNSIRVNAEYKYEEDGETDSSTIHTGKVPICIVAGTGEWYDNNIVAPVATEIPIMHVGTSTNNTVISANIDESIVYGKKISEASFIGTVEGVNNVRFKGKNLPLVEMEISGDEIMTGDSTYETSLRISNGNVLELQKFTSSKSISQNGKTFTLNDDGTVTITGTHSGSGTMEDFYLLGSYDDNKESSRIPLPKGRYYVDLTGVDTAHPYVFRLKSNNSNIVTTGKYWFDVTTDDDYLYAICFRFNTLAAGDAINYTIRPAIMLDKDTFAVHKHQIVTLYSDTKLTEITKEECGKKIPHYGQDGTVISLSGTTGNLKVSYFY